MARNLLHGLRIDAGIGAVGDMMAKYLVRGSALLMTIVMTSPAWAGWDDVAAWLPESMPQPSALGVLMLAILGLLVGRFASHKRRDP